MHPRSRAREQVQPTFSSPVPDLDGLPASQARSELQAAGLRPGRPRHIYSEEPRGTVVKQDIDPRHSGTDSPPHPVHGHEVHLTTPVRESLGPRLSCCRFIHDPHSEFCAYFKCIAYPPPVWAGSSIEDRAFSQSSGDPMRFPQVSALAMVVIAATLSCRGRLVDSADSILGAALE
jgi:PASTA domain